MANLTLAQKVLEQLQVSQAIAAQASQLAQEKTAAAQATEEKIPDVVEALVANGRIPPELREKAASMLRDPLKALDILKNTAAHRSEAELQHLGEFHDGGTQAQQKRASALNGGLSSPYCGVRSSHKRQSDLDFEMQILGRPVNG